MRGKAIAFSSMEHSFRITPAYAGKSITARCPEPGTWDHPRVCGEKKKMNMRKDKRMGSPPRMRGKDHHKLV